MTSYIPQVSNVADTIKSQTIKTDMKVNTTANYCISLPITV